MPDIKLNKQIIVDKIDIINSAEERARREEAVDRYMYYNGNIQPLIKKAIQKEFKKPETVAELCSRIIPVNIIKRV